MDTININMEAIVYKEESGTIVQLPPESSKEEVTNRYLVLKLFAQDFSGDPKIPFWFANLPFIFEATTFVKQYAEHLLKSQMRDILHVFNMNDETIKSYLKRSFVEKLDTAYLDSRIDQFIEDFKSHAQNSLNIERSKFPFAEVEKVTGLSNVAIRNMVDVSKIEDAEIYINKRKKMISYEPHRKPPKYF